MLLLRKKHVIPQRLNLKIRGSGLGSVPAFDDELDVMLTHAQRLEEGAKVDFADVDLADDVVAET